MARYASAPGSISAAIDVAMDTANLSGQSVVTTLADDAAETFTTAQLFNGVIIVTGTTDSQMTTPTAAAIIAALGDAQTGLSCVDLFIRNEGNQTIDLLAGTDVTIDGAATIATTKTAMFRFVVASASTVTCYRVLTADN